MGVKEAEWTGDSGLDIGSDGISLWLDLTRKF